MKNIVIILMGVMLAGFSCRHSGYVIAGRVVGIDDGMIYITRIITDDNVTIGDSVVLKNGKFRITGADNGTSAALLRVKGYDHDIPVFLESGKSHIIIDTSEDRVTVTGTPNNEIMGRFLSEQFPREVAKVRLMEEIENTAGMDDREAINDIFGKYQKIDKVCRATVAEYIHEYANMDFGVYLMIQQANDSTVPFTRIDSLLKFVPVSLHISPLFRILHAKHNSIAALEQGGEAPEFILPDRDGSNISLSSLRGNYVLVEFWASWCSPCRAEIPHLVEEYGKYHSEGFEIIGVSVDNNHDAWTAAIDHHHIPWVNVSDMKGIQKSPVAMQYRVVGVPSSWLLGPDGVVIAKDLRGVQLADKLREVFGY